MAIKVLDAPTDGVTSSWTVPLNSGPAATRDHLTVIFTCTPAPGTGTLKIGFGTAAFAVIADANCFVGLPAARESRNSVIVEIPRYRDASPGPVYYSHDYLTPAQTGNVATAGPLTEFIVKTYADNATTPEAPPAGGNLEVWVG